MKLKHTRRTANRQKTQLRHSLRRATTAEAERLKAQHELFKTREKLAASQLEAQKAWMSWEIEVEKFKKLQDRLDRLLLATRVQEPIDRCVKLEARVLIDEHEVYQRLDLASIWGETLCQLGFKLGQKLHEASLRAALDGLRGGERPSRSRLLEKARAWIFDLYRDSPQIRGTFSPDELQALWDRAVEAVMQAGAELVKPSITTPSPAQSAPPA